MRVRPTKRVRAFMDVRTEIAVHNVPHPAAPISLRARSSRTTLFRGMLVNRLVVPNAVSRFSRRFTFPGDGMSWTPCDRMDARTSPMRRPLATHKQRLWQATATHRSQAHAPELHGSFVLLQQQAWFRHKPNFFGRHDVGVLRLCRIWLERRGVEPAYKGVELRAPASSWR